jgi:hypothetical protein
VPQKSDTERIDLLKLRYVEVKEQYQFTISSKFSTVQNLDSNVDMKRAGDNIKKYRTPSKQTPGKCE